MNIEFKKPRFINDPNFGLIGLMEWADSELIIDSLVIDKKDLDNSIDVLEDRIREYGTVLKLGKVSGDSYISYSALYEGFARLIHFHFWESVKSLIFNHGIDRVNTLSYEDSKQGVWLMYCMNIEDIFLLADEEENEENKKKMRELFDQNKFYSKGIGFGLAIRTIKENYNPQ